MLLQCAARNGKRSLLWAKSSQPWRERPHEQGEVKRDGSGAAGSGWEWQWIGAAVVRWEECELI